MCSTKELTIDTTLVKRLLKDQFPQFKDLPAGQVHLGGFGIPNILFGATLVVRAPSIERYAAQ